MYPLPARTRRVGSYFGDEHVRGREENGDGVDVVLSLPCLSQQGVVSCLVAPTLVDESLRARIIPQTNFFFPPVGTRVWPLNGLLAKNVFRGYVNWGKKYTLGVPVFTTGYNLRVPGCIPEYELKVPGHIPEYI